MDEPLFEIYQLRGDQGERSRNHVGSFVHFGRVSLFLSCQHVGLVSTYYRPCRGKGY